MTAAPRVLIVGDVIDDVVVEPLGPIARATDTPARITPTPGGSAANQAVWLAAAGTHVRLAACVGAADVDRHARLLREAGVEPHLAADGQRPTGTIVILVEGDGERTMFTDRGANLSLDLDALPDTLLDGIDLLHLSGYSLFDARVRTAVLDLVGRARARDVPLSIDPGSTGFLREVGPAAFLGWIDPVEVLLPNLEEARLLTGRNGAEEAATALLEVATVVAVTCGGAGAIVTSRGSSPRAVPAPTVEVVDTTGAGDAFAGSFLAAWLAGVDPLVAARAGVAAGARAISRPGGRPPPRPE